MLMVNIYLQEIVSEASKRKKCQSRWELCIVYSFPPRKNASLVLRPLVTRTVATSEIITTKMSLLTFALSSRGCLIRYVTCN